jgi:hypothetical protein
LLLDALLSFSDFSIGAISIVGLGHESLHPPSPSIKVYALSLVPKTELSEARTRSQERRSEVSNVALRRDRRWEKD